jgi:serine O-acetyltransferase
VSGELSPLAQLREDWVAHGRDWRRPGLRAITVARLGRFQRDSPSAVVRLCVRHLDRILERRMRRRYGIELPWTVTLGRRVVIEHQGAIVVHGFAEIGDDCILRHGVTLGNRRLEAPLEAPRLGARVSVGAGAQILGAVSVGDDVRVGANAVVLDDVPSGATAVGVPAVVVDGRKPRPAAP